MLIVGPERSPVRDPQNRSRSINVAAQLKSILVKSRNKRVSLACERRRQKLVTKNTESLERVPSNGKFSENTSSSADKISPQQNSSETQKSEHEHINSKAITSRRRPTKLERFQRRILDGDSEPLPRLRGLYELARSLAFRPTIRQQPQLQSTRAQDKLARPQTQLEVLGRQVEKHGDRVPLRKITFFVMGRHPKKIPSANKIRLPTWALDALSSRGYTSHDVVDWIHVLRASNATRAFEVMERNARVWPKFLVQLMLYSSASRSQSELVKLFAIVQGVWESFDQEGKIRALVRMTELSAKKLPRGLPRVADLLARTKVEGKKSALRVFNDVLSITAKAYTSKQYQNYTSVRELRDLIDESMIILLDKMAENHVHVKISTLRKVSAAKLAEDSGAAISILRLGKPEKYVDLLEDMKGQEEDLALAYEIAKVERQLSSLEREFLKSHLLDRIKTKEMIKRLDTIQNWRVSAQETFSAWLEFLERRRVLGPAPKDSWISILQMCHDEWTFPGQFWEEAYELMEEDHVLPNTTLLCLVLKGIKNQETLDRILESATTTHLQRMNDQIWQVYLQRLAINHTPRALEIFLNAHTTDSAAGTMDTLNIYYWNILLNGLAIESRQSNDMIWTTRAFDLLAEMERLSIFPTQETLSAICKLGNWAGDKVRIKDVPAWKAAINKWHEWIIRPEDFGYNFNLPGISRLIPSQVSYRKFIRLAGNYGEYGEVFDATWGMLRFGVVPDWESLLDVDLYIQLSGDEKRTLAVREMFREWLGRYPTPREVIWHYRRWLRADVKNGVQMQEAARLEYSNTPITKQIEAPRTSRSINPGVEARQETVVDQWLRREESKPWFERD